jgi:predicted nucleic-acid-binding protein
MTGIDTNVLLRFVAQDDPVQSPIAARFFASLNEKNPGWIGLATVLEFVWVMSSRKQAGRAAIAALLGQLLQMEGIVVERAGVVAQAVRLFGATRADFADCLIAASAQAAGCTQTVTFDRVAGRDAGMVLLEV